MFWFTALFQASPVGEPASETDAIALPPRAIESIARGRILIAEDNPINRELASELLQALGYEYQLACDGREALDLVLSSDYDVVLMDCEMPELDGLSATELIRAAGITVPIVALTAHAIDGYGDRCLRAGMSDYLTKPFTRAQLMAVLDRWITGGVVSS
jgi:CheY-like chemotaxis protein